MNPLEKGLPCDVAAERFVLGSLILDHQTHSGTFSLLSPDDFSSDVHRRIYAALFDMDATGRSIDRITVASYLKDQKELDAIGGLSYLVSLDTGLPDTPHIETYVEIVKEKSSLRRIVYAAQNLMNRCLSNDGTASEIISLADRTLMEIGYKPGDTGELLSVGEVVDQTGLDRFMNPFQSGGDVKTPWTKLTDLTAGYRRGELFVLAGNPSMGKSAAGLQIAAKVAEAGLGTLIFSLEMSRQSLIHRMACWRARVDSAKLRSGYLNAEERSRLATAIHELSRFPLWIAEHGISTVSAIRAALRRKKTKHEVFMVLIDYLQLLQGIGRNSNRNEEISTITRGLKLMAVDDNVNVHLLSQLTRDNLKERRPPALHDLRDSGSVEQDADAVAFVWRPEMLHREREDLRGKAELLLWKQRNGPTGRINLVWLNHLAAFENPAEEV